MKNISILLICFIAFSFSSNAQDSTVRNNWFFSLSTGFCLGGPGSSMVSLFENQGFAEASNGWFGTSSYPTNEPKPRLLFMAGKRITRYGSIYLVLGQPVAGKVTGYNGLSSIVFDYNVFQFTLGYQFSFPNTHFKLGIGPSLFSFTNTPQADFKEQTKQSSTVAGATLTMRVPFGQEKKPFGVEFFSQFNLAPGINLGEIENYGTPFKGGTVSMTYLVIGITFTLRG
jgi:hypothetical protein